jgi:hypothetical protein
MFHAIPSSPDIPRLKDLRGTSGMVAGTTADTSIRRSYDKGKVTVRIALCQSAFVQIQKNLSRHNLFKHFCL